MKNILLSAAIGLTSLPLFSATDQIFDSSAPQEFTLQAPFQQLLAQLPSNGEFETETPQIQITQEPFIEGSLMYKQNGTSVELPVTIVMRGHGSKSDCGFPKLKLKFNKKNVMNSLFEGNKTINLGTHCADLNGQGGLGTHTYGGRVGSEIGPVREALAYRLQAALELPTLTTKVVTINYIDTATHETFSRKAFFIEDVDQWASNRKGQRDKQWSDTWQLGSQKTFFGSNLKQLGRLFFFEALIGNEDFNIALPSIKGIHFNPMPQHAIWNAYAVRLPENRLEFVGYDYDLATIITGPSFVTIPPPQAFTDFTGRKEYYEWAIFKMLQMSRSFFSKSDLDETISFFRAHREKLENLVTDDSVLDAKGRDIFRAHLKAFYEMIETQFYLPVTNAEQEKVYLTNKKNKLCQNAETYKALPLTMGLLAKTLETKGDLVQVQLLDVRNALPYCTDKPVWLEKAPSMSATYPQ